MTSQVVVMNKVAVALASDSSVTMSSGKQILRSFPTAEKIFPFALPHRLAVLHSGSTELLQVPYVVLLGEWHRSLTTPLARVSEYAEAFCRWLEGLSGLFDDASQEAFLDWMIRDYFLSVRSEILKECERQSLPAESWESPAAAAAVKSVLTQGIEHLQQLPSPPDLAGLDVDAFVKAHRQMVQTALDRIFNDTPRSKEGDDLLHRLVAAVVSANEPFSSDADLVFVGFGEQELFPASQVVSVGGLFDNHLKKNFWPYSAVSIDDPAYLSPYAQTEAVNTFLRGYHPDFLTAAHETLESALTAQTHQVNDTAAPETAKYHEELTGRFERHSWEEFVQPLVRTVAGLPGVELARMAESLVGLQVLRKLTRAEAETVGGPVDVATITRADGFNWCRHKSLL